MVFRRHTSFNLLKTRKILRVFGCACVCVLLPACYSSDSGGQNGATAGTTSGIVNDQSGNSASPDVTSGAGSNAGADSTAGDSAGVSSGSGTAGGSTDTGAGDNFIGGSTNGATTTANSTTAGATPGAAEPSPANPIPDSFRPMAIRLQTLEEQSIDGAFELFGETADLAFPAQRFSVITQPRNGTVIHTVDAREFTYAPEQDFFGEDDFIYSIGPGLAARVTIEVTNINDAPVIFDQVPRVISQGSTYTELLIANDPDNDPLNYRATNLPKWLQLDASTGLLSGKPTQFNVGLFENIAFSVSDPAGLTSEVTGITIEVIDINDAPTINVEQFPSSLDASEAVSVNLYPDDPDGDLVRVSVEPNDFLDLSVTGSTVNVIALEVADVTDVNLVVEATDLLGHVAREIIPLTIYPINSSGRGRTIRGRSSGEGVHLVILGDGYRADQQQQFRAHAEALIKQMQADIGMLAHFSAWSVHMVETPSIDSGIDDEHGTDIRDTVFNTGYSCKDVQRLICGDRTEMYAVAIDEYPNFDQVVVLVNDARYGGSGGIDIAIASTGSMEIALHEMGHSIAGLADEYVDNYIPGASIPLFVEGRFANVSASNDPNVVPWRHWFSNTNSQTGVEAPTGVGVFEGAYYRSTGFYRPSVDSLMRSYDGVLGPVNGEQWALSVYSMANPVLDIFPVNRLIDTVVGDTVDFSVVPLFEPTIQSVEWRLDSQLIDHSGGIRPTVSLNLPEGEYELTLKVRDISGLIRKPEPHAGVFEWNWTIAVAQ